MDTASNSPQIQSTNPTLYRKAIEVGKQVFKTSNSKAEAAREIYKLLVEEPRDVILQAFIEGASITPKGSPTYFYNIKRKFRKQRKNFQQ